MGRIFEAITAELKEFMESAPVFFVATAPNSADNHINISPKGLDSFRVISPNQVAYLDLTGSGAETIAHIRENGRITIMFMAFSGKPNILRIYGRGETVVPSADEFGELMEAFVDMSGVRSIIKVDVERIADSCGFGVPLMDYVGPRDELIKWGEKKGPDGLVKYQSEKNQQSIDGLPALDIDPALTPTPETSPE